MFRKFDPEGDGDVPDPWYAVWKDLRMSGK